MPKTTSADPSSEFDRETGEFYTSTSENDGASAPVLDERVYVKTITPATIGAAPERALIKRETVLCCRISGTIMGIELQYGADDPKQERPFKAFAGSFEADVYNDDGSLNTWRSGFCYLPGGFHEDELSIFARMTPEQQETGHTFSKFFAAQFVDRSGTKYRWVASNAMRVSAREASTLDRLRLEAREVARMRLGSVPMLKAPAATDEAAE